MTTRLLIGLLGRPNERLAHAVAEREVSPMLRIIGTLLQKVQTDPTAEGLPGAELIQKLLNWAQMVALWASLGSLFAGAAMYGLAREGGSYGGAQGYRRCLTSL